MKNNICFLIDDDEDDREIFTFAVENANNAYTCVTALNGKDALGQLEADPEFRPEFIFIDLNMPYMSGRECLKQIKNKAGFATVPVIIYTTSSYEKDVEETKELGATHFLVKPPSMETLTAVLKDILDGEELPYYLDV
jgi:CheY-like chemotaxis protein